MKHLWIVIIALAACNSVPQEEPVVLTNEGIKQYFNQALKPFYHGVASGDPTQDAVVIWTRVTPQDSLSSIEVQWEVAYDKEFDRIAKEGLTYTRPEQDYTVKVDVTSLEAGQEYYYRFKAMGFTSPLGRTQTAYSSKESLKMAVVSCSNYEFGYFNAYRAIANHEGIDAVLHLGDYIYEYGPGTYGDSTSGRVVFPPREVVTLSDYRLRYSQYRLDPDLQAVHQAYPMIAIWDDHEIANDSYKEGAQNHQEGEGSYEDRKAAARQTYYEWMPVRVQKQLYRTFNYGPLAKLIMLDERLEGRSAPVDSLQDPLYLSEERSMLGEEQLQWFKEELADSTHQWKIVGNQVIFSYLNWGHPTFNINLDSWDGYPVEQNHIMSFLDSAAIENVVFVTGDTHSSWAFEVTNDPFTSYDPASAEGAVAIEFGTTSINSGNSDERFPRDSVIAHEQKIVNSPVNPHLKYANLRDHGYMVLTLTSRAATAQWFYVPTLTERTSMVNAGPSFSVISGTHQLIGELP